MAREDEYSEVQPASAQSNHVVLFLCAVLMMAGGWIALVTFSSKRQAAPGSPSGSPVPHSLLDGIWERVSELAILAWLALPIGVCFLGHRLLKPTLRQKWYNRVALMVPVVSFVAAYFAMKIR